MRPSRCLGVALVALLTVGAVVRAQVPVVKKPSGLDSARARSEEPADSAKRKPATYFAFQVEKQAVLVSPSPQPRYPDVLKSAGVEGEVLMQFVVGTDGRVDPATMRVLKSPHDLFSSAVRRVIPDLRFEPAMLRGQAVRQLIQMPFKFSLP